MSAANRTTVSAAASMASVSRPTEAEAAAALEEIARAAREQLDALSAGSAGPLRVLDRDPEEAAVARKIRGAMRTLHDLVSMAQDHAEDRLIHAGEDR